MKKITAVIISLLLILPSLMITTPVSASGYEPPKLVYEPITMTIKTGSQAVLTVVAEGEGLRFAWVIATSEAGQDHTFYIDHKEAIDGFQALDGKGKMKVSFKEEKLENNRVSHQLIIDNIIDFNYGAAVTCTVSNEHGSTVCDTAYIYTSENAPAQMNVQMLAKFSVRIEKLVKLAANTIIPSGAGYNDDDVEFNWYQTMNGDKAAGFSLDEHDPVLMAEAYAPTAGTYYFYCSIYVKKGITDFYYETGVTEMTVYETKNVIKFDKDELVLNDGEKGTVTVTATVEPEKDKGTLTYQWYMGMSPYDMSTEVPGATSPAIEITGANWSATRFYTCIVTNHTTDDFEFDNSKDNNPYVKVVYTGKKGATFKKQPADVEVIEGNPATFTVEVEDAKTFQWYYIAPGSETPIELENPDPNLVEGETTPFLTVYPSLDMNGAKYLCEVTSPDDVVSRSDSALLTVKEEPVWSVPVLIDRSPNVVAHVGDDVDIWVGAKAPEGAELECNWYVKEDGGEVLTPFATGLQCKPDNTKAGKFIYTYTIRTVGGTKEPSEFVTDIFTVEFLRAEPEEDTTTGAGNDTASSTDNGAIDPPATTDGGGSAAEHGSTAVVILAAVVGVLALALAGVGIYVLVKNRKKK